MEEKLDDFGRIFINEVRDRSIRLFDKKIQGIMKDENSQRLYEKVNCLGENEKKLIYEIIPDIVDLSMHNMLCMFEDHEEFKIYSHDENLNEISDGLSGELYTSDGWIARFSEQRTNE